MTASLNSTNAWRTAMWSAAVLLLLAPLVAMQFSDEMRWDAWDFLVFAAMLLVAGGAGELMLRRGGLAYRLAAAIAIGGAFLTVWVNLAVGIIGEPDHPANLMFVGVLAVGGVGACLARLRPAGLAGAMAAMVVCQMGVAAVCIAAGWIDGLVSSAVLTVVWLASALLFRSAATSIRPVERGA